MRSVIGPPARQPHRLCPVLIGVAMLGSHALSPLAWMVSISCPGVATIGAVIGRATRPSEAARAPEEAP